MKTITCKIEIKSSETQSYFTDFQADYSEELLNFVKWNAYNGEYQILDVQDPRTLDEIKTERIAKSKSDLAAYLESHPLQWTDGNYYSITAEKQQQLTSKLFSAYTKKLSGISYDLTWNSTGDICHSWTIEELSPLAYAIEARVTSLVSYQQTQEVAMRNAITQEELDAIVVDYDTVSMPEATV